MRTHIRNATTKLGAATRVQAVAMIVRGIYPRALSRWPASSTVSLPLAITTMRAGTRRTYRRRRACGARVCSVLGEGLGVDRRCDGRTCGDARASPPTSRRAARARPPTGAPPAWNEAACTAAVRSGAVPAALYQVSAALPPPSKRRALASSLLIHVTNITAGRRLAIPRSG